MMSATASSEAVSVSIRIFLVASGFIAVEASAFSFARPMEREEPQMQRLT